VNAATVSRSSTRRDFSRRVFQFALFTPEGAAAAATAQLTGAAAAATARKGTHAANLRGVCRVRIAKASEDFRVEPKARPESQVAGAQT
jgi:hypothetical protein